MSSSTSQIPKMPRVEKHCNLCQNHGGTQDTHNTNECAKYEKDGTLKSEWAKKSSAKAPGKSRKLDGKSFSQVMDHLTKMEKAIKKENLLLARRNPSIVAIVIPIPSRKSGGVVRRT